MAGPVLDAAVSLIAGQIRELASRVQQLERNQRSGYNTQNMSIDGGSLTINGPDGKPAVVVGAQSDGTFSARQVATVVPPGAPSTPIASPGINGLYVAWDGLMATGGTPPYDFAAVQVHVSAVSGFTPDSTTLQGHMVGAGLFGVGGLTPGTTYYVVLTAVNGIGDTGAVSAQASGIPAAVPAGSIPAGSITALQIATGTITAAQIAAAASILGSQIATGTITSANILAGTITTALLAAGIVVAGIVDATTVTGATLRNSSTHPRTSINPDGSISITSSGGIVIFDIGPDGTIFWYNAAGVLLMQLQPGGTQLIYASLTGPGGWSFEPPTAPNLLFSVSSATASIAYGNSPQTNTQQGQAVVVIASCAGATAAASVSDTAGNSYALVQSVTSAAPYQQVFVSQNSIPLSTSDTITVTYAASNTSEKNIVALAAGKVLTSGLTDFSAPASGTGTSPSVSGTPANYGDLVIFALTNATAGGTPSALADGWQTLVSQSAAGQQVTSVYYGTSVSGAAMTASAAIVSAPWSAVILGLSASPAAPAASSSPVAVNATLSSSTAWAADGQFSIKVTHAGTTTGWGFTTPAFAVQAGATVSMQAQIFTPAALSAISIGFTFWSGAGGTGTNLGTVSGDQGTLATAAGAANLVSITGATVPAGAQSATFNVRENAADASGAVYYVDAIQVPGGLVYSNSPFPGTDRFGNPFDQGINFIGLPGLTNVFGVEDPFGNQLATIDGSGNITGQIISAATDILVGGQSIVNSLVTPAPAGLLNRGWSPTRGSAWPSTAVGIAETALFEVDQLVKAGRVCRISLTNTDFIPTAVTQAIFKMRWTTDGTTPTTSAPNARQRTMHCATANQNYQSPYIENVVAPSADTLYRVLITANMQTTGTLQFQDYMEVRFEDLGAATTQNNANNSVLFGTGTSGGGGSLQTYTEYFYPVHTWSYDEFGLKGTDISLFQGAYSGEGYAQHGWIQWGTGSLGNSLSTVAGYTLNKASLRLTNLHSWYNNGMTVSLHTGSSLGSGSSISAELASWFISEGNTFDNVITSVGHTVMTQPYTVLHPPSSSLSLNYYGYFYGRGSNTGAEPRLTAVYTH